MESFMFYVQTLLSLASLYINLFINLARCSLALDRLHVLGGCSRLLLQLVVFQDILLPRLFSAVLGNHLTCISLCQQAIAKFFIFTSPKHIHQVLKSSFCIPPPCLVTVFSFKIICTMYLLKTGPT